MAPRQSGAEAPYASDSYAWFVVAILLVAYIFNFIDREVIAILVKPIKLALDVTDTQMGYLMGVSFALFYTALGIPIAWAADRGNRKLIIAAGVLLWSVMTVLCGFADSYLALFVARVGVGIGEAALSPPALSLIKDTFRPEKLGRAIGIYSAGISCGSGVANVIGGTLYPALAAMGTITLPLLGTHDPWQAMFILVGLPGILVALAVLVIKEPPRRGSADMLVPVSFPATLTFVRARWRTYGVLFVGLTSMTVCAYGLGFWAPEFLRRTYALNDGQFGHFLQWRGVIMAVTGLISVLVGGYLCDWFRRRHADGYLRVALIGLCFLMLGYGLMPLMPTPELAIAMMIPATIGGALPTAAGSASVVAIAPPNMRAQIMALYYFVLNLVGLMVGPTLVGYLTDEVFGVETDLNKAMSLVAFIACAYGIALVALVLKPYRASAAEAERWS